MNSTMGDGKIRYERLAILIALCVAFLFGVAGPAAAQKDKRNKKNPPASDATPSTTEPKLTDEQTIDRDISEMLAAWQINDTERLHRYYADDVTVVSGNWMPPVVGWTDFLASYQRLAARMQLVRKDRQNTLVHIAGNLAWACFQWDFSATVDGQHMGAQGQTTLIFEKRNDRWLIVHDHTSIVQMIPSPLPAGAQPSTTPPR